MLQHNRSVRLAAVAGAVVAASATAMMALVAGTASAGEPGRCTQNVNVREEPNAQARIVALCESGKQVELGETRDGWVRLEELGGWAAADYVKADRTAAGQQGAGTATSPAPSGDERSSSAGSDGDDEARSTSRDGDSSSRDGVDAGSSRDSGSGSGSRSASDGDSGSGSRSTSDGDADSGSDTGSADEESSDGLFDPFADR